INWLYTQLTSETRTPQGWRNIARRKNEAFDLLAYCCAFLEHPDIAIHRIRWDQPPSWAGEWD
ncbi:MAG: terminase gpA endonuclease subunit, partial [Pseudomonadota bacterium]